jgi:hypothetical protein
MQVRGFADEELPSVSLPFYSSCSIHSRTVKVHPLCDLMMCHYSTVSILEDEA